MPCDPRANTLNPPIHPPLPGIPLSPVQSPLPNINIPNGLLESLTDLVNFLQLPLPSGTLKPNPDDFMKNVWGAVADLLSQFAPFLSFYNFILALFNLIVCIIEVLCAIPNPFKVSSALRKLFSTCLPPFLALFPWAALIAMIIALILLIIALVTYIIDSIIGIIQEIIRNLEVLSKSVQLQDAEATLAGAQKIGLLFCTIENLLSIFLAIAAIVSIIQSLAAAGGSIPCDDSSEDGCCSTDICPSFIKNNPDGITGISGKLIYHNKIGTDLASVFSSIPGFNASLFNIPPIRSERWQLIDTDTDQVYKFSDIITPVNGNIYWPEGTSYNSETSPGKAPYTVDLKLITNPLSFGIADGLGTRKFVIKDCIVVQKPYLGTLQYDQSLNTSNSTGTLSLEGGLVYEEDGETPYMVEGKQATLNTFIHKQDTLANAVPSVEDEISIDNIEFTLNINHPVLMQHSLITAGCLPEVSVEKNILSQVLISEDIRAVINKLNLAPAGVAVPSTGFFPNISGAYECVTGALSDFRQNVSIENAAIFQSAVETCLGDLLNQSLATYCDAVSVGASQFKSTAELNTNLEFLSRRITAKVILKDFGGTVISQNMPEHCQEEIASLLKGSVTLGEITKFSYDGSGGFEAHITSEKPGDGDLTITFNGKLLSKLNQGNATVTSSIEENVLQYTFVDASGAGMVRRGPEDISEQVGG